MAFPTHFLDEIKERVSVSSVVGRKVKLVRKGKEYSGLCPFHHEKTPSFTVNDEKGFYHCFGCGAHGGVINFLTDCEKMPFIEAVEHLANLAGLKMPVFSAKNQDEENKTKKLFDIMEKTCQFFEQNLLGPKGLNALAYLKNRGITQQVAQQFRLGYAPSGKELVNFFQSQNISFELAQQLGLIAKNYSREGFHDYFYDRVMFPILDKRKRVIGFGGRLMQKGEPKYLNSPDTDLFHKGEQLYGLPNAVSTIREKNAAIVVEGYMDVIALHSSGFTNAVAPLGTAFTENQLQLLWKECDEPIICFDGDRAGRKASSRALVRALPLLGAGKSLQFVFLPDPFDPDDMIRKKSPQAFQSAINNAKSLFYALWNMLLENRTVDTPERKAKLEKDAFDIVAKIQDERTKNYYIKEIKNELWTLNRRKNNANLSFSDAQNISRPQKQSIEGRMLLAYLLCYPSYAQNHIEEIASIQLYETTLNEIKETILEKLFENPDISTESLEEEIKASFSHINIPEVEMLKKSNKSGPEVLNDISNWIHVYQKRTLEETYKQKFIEFERTNNPEIWEEIKEIQAEIQNLSLKD